MKDLLKPKKGFTLVEMIVTIAVIGVLVLIGAPRLLGHIEKAQLARVQHDVKIMEQELEIEFLNNQVDIEDWNTNAKDLGSLILQDKLYDKKGFANTIDKSHLEKYFNQNSADSVDKDVGLGGMLYVLGDITPFNVDNQEQKDDDDDDIANLIASGYKIIPEEYKDIINTELEGTFYTNEGGTVYYEHGKPLSTQKTSVDKVCEAPLPSPDYEFDHESGTIVKWNGTEQHLTIPSSFKVGDKCYPVRILGTGSFMQGGKRTIKTVIIPESVQRIEEKAFYGNELTEVEIPHSVNYIGESAFEYNYIETVIIRNKVGVITVSGGSFDNNGPSRDRTVTPSYKQPSNKDLGIVFDTSRGAIVSSNRPGSVVHIPETIIVNGKEEVIKVVDRGAYQGLGLISVVMPEGLERIEDYAFSGNQLTGVTIPSTVNHIGNYAFSFNEQVHSLTGDIVPTIKSVMINNEEQFRKIDKNSGDIKEHGVKVDLLNNKVKLLDHVFVNSLGNKVIIVDEFVPGTTEEQKENHIVNDEPIKLPSLPSKPKDPVKDEDGSYVSPELGPEGLMSVADYGLVAPITDPEGLVSVVDYETIDPITTPEGLDSLRQYNDGPISFKGIGAAAFDDSLDTSTNINILAQSNANNKIVTWDGDLTDRMVSIRASGSELRMTFINDSGSVIYHQDNSGETAYSQIFFSESTSGLTSGTTRKVKVPKEATGMRFYRNSSSGVTAKIYDISVEDAERPVIDKDTISHAATNSSITLNWDKRYKKAYIYEGSKFLAEVSGSSYTHTPLYSNSAHTYNITLLNDSGVGTTATYNANVRTMGIDFRDIGAEAFDDSLDTSANISILAQPNANNKIVTWGGDLTDRIVSIRASGSDLRMTFINGSGSVIYHQDSSGETAHSQIFFSETTSGLTSGTTRKVKVPKGAIGMRFYRNSSSGATAKIYDISVEDAERPVIDKDTISHTATNSSITLNWDVRYKKAYIYEGSKFLAEVSGSSYTHTPLYSNSAHSYNITLLNDSGVGTTATYNANVRTMGVDFRGIGAEAFDDSLDTSIDVSILAQSNANNKIVTWDGDLTDRMVSIRASGSELRMAFINGSGSVIYHQDSSGETAYSQIFFSETTSGLTSGTTRKVKVPKGAIGMRFYRNSSSGSTAKIYDISVEDAERPVIDKDTISHTATSSSITLNWDVRYKKAYIYEGSKFLTEVSGSSYTHTPLYSNSAHTYNITLLNDSGVGTTATYNANVRTMGIDFRDIGAEAFDDSLDTSANINILAQSNTNNKIVTWGGDLTDRMVSIRASGSELRMAFINGSGSVIYHQDSSGETAYSQIFFSETTSGLTSGTTRKVKVPKGAIGMRFYRNSSEGSTAKIYDISVEY